MDPTPQTSTLLASLPREEYARVAPRLSRIELPLGKVLQEAGEAVRDMYFPTGACIVSLLYAGREGESTEIAVVGNEGLVGVAAYLGGKTFPSRSVVQNAGSLAYRNVLSFFTPSATESGTRRTSEAYPA